MMMIRQITKTLLSFFLFLSVLIGFLGFTRIGFVATYELARPFLPGHLSIQKIEGHLFSAMHLAGISYTDPHSFSHFDIDQLDIRYHLWKWLFSSEDNARMVVSGIHFHLEDRPLMQQGRIELQLTGIRNKFNFRINGKIENKNFLGSYSFEGYREKQEIFLERSDIKLPNTQLHGSGKIILGKSPQAALTYFDTQKKPIFTAVAYKNTKGFFSLLNVEGEYLKIQSNIRVDSAVTASWRIESHTPLIQLLLNDATAEGEMLFQGTVVGTRQQMKINTRFRTRGMDFGNLDFNQADVQLKGDLSNASSLLFSLQANGIHWKDTKIANVKMESTLKQNNNQWMIALNQLDVLFDQNYLWNLEKNGNAVFDPNKTQGALDNVCMHHGSERFCLASMLSSSKSGMLTASIENINTIITEFLPTTQLNASVSGKIALSKKAEKPLQLDASLQSSRGSFTFTDTNKQAHFLFFDSMMAKAKTEKQSLRLDFSWLLNAKTHLSATALFPEFGNFQAAFIKNPVQGNVNLQIDDLKFISALFPSLSYLKGSLASNLQINGTLDQPIVKGSTDLSKGEVGIPALNLQVTQLRGNMQGDSAGGLHFTLSAQSGGGNITLRGDTELKKTGMPSTITIQGDRFLAMDTTQYHFLISPQLKIQTQANTLSVTGRVDIPEATITLRSMSSSVNALPADIEYITDAPGSTWIMHSLIQLELGSNVNLNIMGISGKLAGGIWVEDKPNSVTTAKGVLYLQKDAVFKAYGQSLKIRTGRLLYTGGSIENPGLDIQAVRSIQSFQSGQGFLQAPITPSTRPNTLSGSGSVMPYGLNGQLTVGINVQGSAQDPRIILFSEPAGLSQSDMLAYLLLGHGTQSASGGDASLLLNAASALNIGGNSSEDIVSQLKNKLGLDEVDVESETDINLQAANPALQSMQNTALVLGKALSPRLYIHYSVGLLSPVSALKVQYLLSERWTLQSEASTLGSGVDLLYTIERE